MVRIALVNAYLSGLAQPQINLVNDVLGVNFTSLSWIEETKQGQPLSRIGEISLQPIG